MKVTLVDTWPSLPPMYIPIFGAKAESFSVVAEFREKERKHIQQQQRKLSL
jgi:hypothetical protein